LPSPMLPSPSDPMQDVVAQGAAPVWRSALGDGAFTDPGNDNGGRAALSAQIERPAAGRVPVSGSATAAQSAGGHPLAGNLRAPIAISPAGAATAGGGVLPAGSVGRAVSFAQDSLVIGSYRGHADKQLCLLCRLGPSVLDGRAELQ